MRLDRFLSGQGAASRKEARSLAKAGLITVDGIPVCDPSAEIDPERADVAVRGVPVCYRKHLYLMLNKPRGVVCATEDSRYPTVLDLLPEEFRRRGLFPAGRLDVDTEGFVLITDDGAFAHRILSPRHHVPKTYRARLSRPLAADAAERICGGVTLSDGTRCLPAELVLLEDGETPLAEIILFEGKYHEVKRIFEAVGNRVTALTRTKIGELALDSDLPVGGVREIMHKEVLQILGSNSSETSRRQ